MCKLPVTKLTHFILHSHKIDVPLIATTNNMPRYLAGGNRPPKYLFLFILYVRLYNIIHESPYHIRKKFLSLAKFSLSNNLCCCCLKYLDLHTLFSRIFIPSSFDAPTSIENTLFAIFRQPISILLYTLSRIG